MLDEQRIERNPVLRVDDRPQRLLGLFGALRAYHAEAVRDPVDVGIDGNGGDPVAEDEHAVRGLGTDAGERRELLVGTGDDPVEPGEQGARAVAHDAGLHVIESRRPDERLDRGGAGRGERRRVRVPCEQEGARAVGVRVLRPLGEDRPDHHLERVLGVVAQVRTAPVARAVERRQPVEHRFPFGRPETRRAAHRRARVRAGAPGRPSSPASTFGGAPSPGSERSGSSWSAPRRSSPTR